MYATKATPPVETTVKTVKNRTKWLNAGPAGVEVKKLLDTEDAVVTAIENGAANFNDVIAYVMTHVTDYDVTVVRDLYDEFCATIVSKHEGI
ncbi:uncharacterized protein METZ01_LOCUS164917 [marine metagenome]|uniref:Uncharacterized protein n=1 Tax=marine metagenome TaxID=408172 RepID=A0A382BFN3_9ZZZZ